MSNYKKHERLMVLNDFAFFKVMGEKGDERQLLPVISIIIIDFDYFKQPDYHLSFHLWEDTHRDLVLSDVCEIHFLDMTGFRKFKRSADYSLEKPLHRWLTYFDKLSSEQQIQEVTGMDVNILMAQDKMEVIHRTPELLRLYEAYEKAELDWNSSMADARDGGYDKAKEEDKAALNAKDQELDAKDRELQELRRQLAELQGKQGPSPL